MEPAVLRALSERGSGSTEPGLFAATGGAGATGGAWGDGIATGATTIAAVVRLGAVDAGCSFFASRILE